MRVHRTDHSAQQRSLQPHGKSFLGVGEDNRTHGERKGKLLRAGSCQAGVISWSVLVPHLSPGLTHVQKLSPATRVSTDSPLFGKCWGLTERRVPILPSPPGTEKPPGKPCFARVLGWSCPAALALGFIRIYTLSHFVVPHLQTPEPSVQGNQKMQERPVGQAVEVQVDARGWKDESGDGVLLHHVQYGFEPHCVSAR